MGPLPWDLTVGQYLGVSPCVQTCLNKVGPAAAEWLDPTAKPIGQTYQTNATTTFASVRGGLPYGIIRNAEAGGLGVE